MCKNELIIFSVCFFVNIKSGCTVLFHTVYVSYRLELYSGKVGFPTGESKSMAKFHLIVMVPLWLIL